MAIYALRQQLVEAEQFLKDKPRPRGVDAQDCYCASLAQDGRRCELHKEHGRRYGLVSVGEDRRKRVEIEYGYWIITTPGRYWPVYAVLTNDEFQARYEPAEQHQATAERVVSLEARIKQAEQALSWDQPWVPGKHYAVQTDERINRALTVLGGKPEEKKP